MGRWAGLYRARIALRPGRSSQLVRRPLSAASRSRFRPSLVAAPAAARRSSPVARRPSPVARRSSPVARRPSPVARRLSVAARRRAGCWSLRRPL
ncbi:hypothetical protein FIBSPDRAFT_965986 [Athelia psychrophila]|uniref:Uncharacterized protein n=1 Tax=Athelia psychrophila TaxID=1759441 RepID=A0A167XAG3_9AGAM|nr:hypothetical protein FIBSPDRAFT_965986 [Fibularhizoctonia sp. CBS 109695]